MSPNMVKMKKSMAERGVKRLGSADCGFKKLPAEGCTKWTNYGRGSDLNGFFDQAVGALTWLNQNSQGAWRYGAQQRQVPAKDQFGYDIRQVEMRHRVQFENASDALLFKLSYIP